MTINMHDVVRGAINVVNSDEMGVLYVSRGYTLDEYHRQIPEWNAIPVSLQVQAMSHTAWQHVASSNIMGVLLQVWAYGNFQGVNRPNEEGGDILYMRGTYWLVTHPIELWSDWCHVVVTKQLGAPDNLAPVPDTPAPDPAPSPPVTETL